MLLRLFAAVAACLLFIAPAAAQSCQTWADGVKVAAEFSRDNNDRVAAVLLTHDETVATWGALFPGKDGAPHILGVMVSQSDPGTAFIAGFDEGGCLVGSGSIPFGPVLDAMGAVDVQSVFVILDPAPPEPKGEDA